MAKDQTTDEAASSETPEASASVEQTPEAAATAAPEAAAASSETPTKATKAKAPELAVTIDGADVSDLFTRVSHEGRVLRLDADHAHAGVASRLIASLDGYSTIEALVGGALVHLRSVANRTQRDTDTGVTITVGSHHDLDVTT